MLFLLFTFFICFLRIACLGLGTKNYLVMFTHNQIVSCICYKIQNSAIAKKTKNFCLSGRINYL